MLYPPNTVSITAEELDYISKQPETVVVCVVDEYEEQWNFFSKAQGLMNAQCKFYINTHDYRHYFGEVVDLKEYLNPTDGRAEFLYLGNRFTFMVKDNQYAICTAFKDHFKGSFDECQQWLCDYFTALFKKDLPHLNIKFIWS